MGSTTAKSRKKTGGKGAGGGKAASLGPRYQAEIGSFFAVHMLAERAAVPVWGLPPDTTVVSVRCEADEAIDDIVIRLGSGGILYVQAKRTLALSDAKDAPLRSALDQFTRQYLHARDRTGTGVWDRPLDTGDRFILATRSASSSVLTETAADLLDRIRELDPAMAMTAVARTQPEKRALKIFVTLVADAWAAATGTTPSDDEVRDVLRYVHIETLDTHPAGQHEREARKLLRDDVLQNPTQDEGAWTIIRDAAGEASGGQSGLNHAELETKLTTASIGLKSVRSYAADVAKLATRSENARRLLEDFSTIPIAGATLHVPRVAAQVLEDASNVASVLVIGEPGAGKSGAVHDLYVRLHHAGRPVILLAADTLSAPTETGLKTDLQLEHDLVDVLRNWRNLQAGVLIIDALDSLRSNATAATLRRVIATIKREGLNWRVVASIRTFDLRRSAELQKLFKGALPIERADTFADPEFDDYRHVRVPRLSDEELAYVANEAPQLRPLLTSAPPPLAALLRVPFNLSLLAQLIDAGMSAGDLVAVRTQLDLLDLYWERRVGRDDAGRHAREATLLRICEEMIARRRLRVPRLGVIDPAQSDALDDLLREHVITEPVDDAGKPATTEIAFAHHVLFDYATAKLLCRRPPTEFAALLTDRSLPLVIWPSLMMHLHHEWHRDASRASFWTTVFTVNEHAGVPTLSRIIGPMAAAELATDIADFAPLLAALNGIDAARRATAIKALQFVITAVHAGSRPVLGQNAGPWADLAAATAYVTDPAAMYQVANLLRGVMQNDRDLTAHERVQYGVAARALLKFACSDPTYQPLARLAIMSVARTYATDASASRALLEQVIQPDRVKEYGYVELPQLAQDVQRLFDSDAAFVVEIYRATFSYEDQSRDTTSLTNSALLGLTSQRRQDYHGAWYQLGRVFPRFFEVNAIEATRALIATVEGYEARRERHGELPEATFVYAGETGIVRTDYSSMWDGSSVRDDVRSMLAAFEDAVVSAATPGSETPRDVFGILMKQNRQAALWRRFVLAAGRQAAMLKEFALTLLSTPAVLYSDDIYGAARTVLPQMAPHMTEGERAALERTILTVESTSSEDEREYVTRRRNRLAKVLPGDRLVTEEMKTLRAMLDAPAGDTGAALQQHDDEDGPPPGWRGRLRDLDDEWLPEDVRAVITPLDEFSTTYLNSAPAREEINAMLSAADAAVAFMATHADLDEAHRREVDAAVAAVAQAIARNDELRPEDAAYQRARSLLLAASTSPDPKPDPEHEKQWDSETPSLDQGARSRAAQGLIWLAQRAAKAKDNEVLEAIVRLSDDEVASVRSRIVYGAHALAQHAPELAWEILDRVREHEPRFAIVVQSLHPLRYLFRSDRSRCVAHAVSVLKRYSAPRAPELIAREVTYFLVGLYLYDDDPDAKAWVSESLGEADVDPEVSASAVHGIRDAFVAQDNGVRQRAIQLARDVLAPSARFYRDAVTRPEFRTTPLPEEELKLLREHAEVIATVALEAQFALRQGDETPLEGEAKARRDAVVQRFFDESRDLVDEVIAVGYVPASHDVLELLVEFIDVDPRGTFVRIRNLLRSAAETGYQHEHEAMKLVVEIVERYLADYRGLLESDQECRDAVVEMLDLFIEAGWPDTLRLAFRLGDLFR